MSKILFLTDTHIGCRNSHSIIEEHILKFHTYILEYIKQNKIKEVFHLGDMVDDRKNMNIKTWNRFKTSFFDHLRDMGVELTVLCGNHDTYFRSHNEVNALDTLFNKQEYPNVTVINKPTEVIIGKTNFLLMPWMHNSHFEEYKTVIEESKADVLCAHLEMHGFIMHSGVISTDGMETATFEHFDNVFTGHYHSKSSKGNIHYLGTAYDTSWADIFDKKYFHIFDSKAGLLTPVEYDDRLFTRLVYNDTKYKLEVPTNLSGKFVKLIVRGKTDILGFETLLNEINKQEPFELSIVDETLLIGDTDFEADEQSMADISSVITDSIEGLQDTESVDKAKLKVLMQELYRDAISEMISEE